MESGDTGMRITIESTDHTTEINGVPVRHWKGVTDSGVECEVFVHRIAVRADRNCGEFERELEEFRTEMEALGHSSKAIDLRLIL